VTVYVHAKRTYQRLIRQFERLRRLPLNVLDRKVLSQREFTLSNEQTALAIRRVVNTELEACATAINNSDKDQALVQLSEATARLKRLASGLVRQFR
jgi:hypothetical protein